MVERIITTCFSVVLCSAETRDHVLNFLKEVRDRFPEKFYLVANSQPEIANFVLTM